jgi:hypothetical protein
VQLVEVRWLDTSKLSFNNLLLLERIQISWFPGWLPEKELAIALRANAVVEWFLRNKCPEIRDWLDKVVSLDIGKCNQEDIQKAEQTHPYMMPSLFFNGTHLN